MLHNEPVQVADAFRDRFGTEPEIIVVSPGRVNLIGEHTDYNDGFVLPAAIDKYVTLALSRTDGPTLLFSKEQGEAVPFDVAKLVPGQVQGWAKYPAGIAWALNSKLPNLIGTVAATLPMSSGVSSSAAIELGFATAWNQLAGLGHSPLELAKMAQRAENEFVGVNCGIMDQLAVAMGKSGHAMFIDTKSLEITYAHVPDDLAIVLLDTATPRDLAESAYNERRKECEQACEALGVTSLRYASVNLVEENWGNMSETIYKRALHVVTENARCISFVDALDKRNLLKLGLLMRASHESLRDHYEVSSPALDAMVEAAWDAPGCIGARMTGAGFGGSCVALVEASRVESFLYSTSSRYELTTGKRGNFAVCKPALGTHILAGEGSREH